MYLALKDGQEEPDLDDVIKNYMKGKEELFAILQKYMRDESKIKDEIRTLRANLKAKRTMIDDIAAEVGLEADFRDHRCIIKSRKVFDDTSSPTTKDDDTEFTYDKPGYK